MHHDTHAKHLKFCFVNFYVGSLWYSAVSFDEIFNQKTLVSIMAIKRLIFSHHVFSKALKHLLLSFTLVVMFTSSLLIPLTFFTQIYPHVTGESSPTTSTTVSPASSHQFPPKNHRSSYGKTLSFTDRQTMVSDHEVHEESSQSTTKASEYKHTNPRTLQYTDSGNNTLVYANETVETVKNEALNTSNTFDTSQTHDDFFTTEFISNGYENVSGTFIVENITADIDHRVVEDSVSQKSSLNSGPADTDIRSIATSFEVTAPLINITKIRVFFFVSGFSTTLTGEAYITNVSGGTPTETVLGSKITFGSIGNSLNWTELTFPTPVTLSAGVYAIVLNETSALDTFYYIWYYVKDSGSQSDNLNESTMWIKSWIGTWTSTFLPGDLLFEYEYVQLEDTNPTAYKTFSSPASVDLKYNGTAVSTGQNSLLLNGTRAYFTSNVSVTFDVTYRIFYRALGNPYATTTSFDVTNSTVVRWNLTMSHEAVPTGTYQLVNRTLTFYNLAPDWNATLIRRNTTNYSTAPETDTTKVTYSNGSATLLINIMTNIEQASDWLIQFEAPNYLTSVTLKQNGTTVLSRPYEINTTDTLKVEGTLSKTSVNEKNATLLIYDANSVLNYTETNVTVVNGQLVFSTWDLSTLNLNTDVNGTYLIVVQWLSQNRTKVGYFEVNLIITVQTALEGPTNLGDVIKGNVIDLSVVYRSYHNTTNLNGATVYYNTSWNTNDVFSQAVTDANYTTIVDTSGASLGDQTITITAQLSGYVTRTHVISLKIVTNTTLSYAVNTTSPYYLDSVEIIIIYQDVSGSPATNITNAIVTVNGSAANEQADNSYRYVFDTSVLNPSTDRTFKLFVQASKTNYLSQSLSISFNLTDNPTTITTLGSTPTNNSVTPVQVNYSTTALDTVYLHLAYNDTHHNNVVISGATVTHNGSAFATISPTELPDATWNISINPTTYGNYTLRVSFEKAGYVSETYIIRLAIVAAPTAVDAMFFVNNSLIGEQEVVNTTYSEGEADLLEMMLSYYDISHNNDLIESGSLVVLNGTTTAEYNLTVTSYNNGTWKIAINPKVAGLIRIYFELYADGYENRTRILQINVKVASFSLQYTLGDPQAVRFTENHTVIVTVTNTFDNAPVSNVNIATNASDIAIQALGNGQYQVTYYGGWLWYSGLETIEVTFSKTYFATKSVTWNFNITAPPEPVTTYTLFKNGTTSYAAPWNDTIVVVVLWYTNVTGHYIPLNTTLLAHNANNLPLAITMQQLSNGTHVYAIVPLTVGTWTVTFTLYSANYSAYFKNVTFNLQIEGKKRSTATAFTVVGTNVTDTTVSVYYERSTVIGVQWNDVALNILANSTQPTIASNDSVWIVFINLTADTAVHYFEVHGVSAQDVTVSIVFTSPFYEDMTLRLYIHVKSLPTDEIAGVYTQGLIPSSNGTSSTATVGTNATSKLGYRLGMLLVWKVSDNQSVILDADWQVYINGTLLTNGTRGLLVVIPSAIGATNWTLLLWVDFLPEHAYAKGWYNLTVVFSHYGYVSRSLTALVYVKGFDLDIQVQYDPTLVQGATYVIKVIITYANGTNGATNASMNASLYLIRQNTDLISVNGNEGYLSQLNGDQMQKYGLTIRFYDGHLVPFQENGGDSPGTLSPGDPAPDIPVTFKLKVEFTNGTVTTLQGTVLTNAQGIAVYELSKDLTKKIRAIQTLSVSAGGDAVSEPFELSVSIGSQVSVVPVTSSAFNPVYVIAGMIIAVLILISLFVSVQQVRKRKMRETQRLKRAKRKIDDIQKIYMIVVQHADGIRMFVQKSAMHPEFEVDTDLLAGMTSATFSIRQEAVSRLGRGGAQASQRREEIVLDIQHSSDETLSAIITRGYKIFIITYASDILGKWWQQRQKRVHEKVAREIEPFISQAVVADEALENRIRKVLRTEIPLILLEKFTLDPKKLEESTTLKTQEKVLLKRALLSLSPWSGAVRSMNKAEVDRRFAEFIKGKRMLPPFTFQSLMALLQTSFNVHPEDAFNCVWEAAKEEVFIKYQEVVDTAEAADRVVDQISQYLGDTSDGKAEPEDENS